MKWIRVEIIAILIVRKYLFQHELSIPRGEDVTATEILQKMYGAQNMKSHNYPDSQKPGSSQKT